MKKLNIKLENTYGIRKLEHTFDFDKTKTYSIYATNGSMKTSFTKTFGDFGDGNDSKDMIFTERETVREITDENGNELDSGAVFVVKPYDENYASGRTSTLLVNKELKDKYDKIWLNIKTLEDELVKKLKAPSGLAKGIDDEVSEVIMSTKGKFLEAVQRVEKEVNDGKDPVLNEVSYSKLFNEKVVKLLSDKAVQADLNEYITRYDELVEQSKYFRKGVFNHTNASTIAKTLVQNGFFDASHTVSFSDGTAKSEISSEADLKKVIEDELQEILKDEKLRKAFDKLDKKLTSNNEVREFRDYITEHKELIPELANINYFKQRIWIDYFKVCLADFNNLITAHNDAKKELDDIREQANQERTRWAEVVDVFNSRFNVPFVLSVENQSDVILDGLLPSLSFEFRDEESKKLVKRDELLQVLSTGERKALYILNVLFEIEARKDLGEETLLIVDDIADSFDYKNKYAIIEYLKDTAELDNFYQIILTHNFDFFRTIQSRYVPYKHCLMVNKKTDGIDLVVAEYINNPFKHFLENTAENAKLLALIPFVRNIVEYTKGEDAPDFTLLTSTLHIKKDTETITIKNVKDIIKDVFNKDVTVSDENKIVADLFTETADTLLSKNDSLGLENKIVLSVAIRLKAEKFMINEINDTAFVESISKNQTAKLADRYITDNPTKDEEIAVIKKVNLITPQNIHINSFMYEPILDMSDVELKDLYNRVSTLGSK